MSLVGGLFVSLFCIQQTDLKSLIDYSSVAHMSMVVVLQRWVIRESVELSPWWWLMVCVLLVFFCLSNISYECFGRRSSLINWGLINLTPRMAKWWILLSACNMASSPSLNLLGEIGLLSRLVSWPWCLMHVLVLISFISAIYTLYIHSYSQHSSIYSGLYSCSLGCVHSFIHSFHIPLILYRCGTSHVCI